MSSPKAIPFTMRRHSWKPQGIKFGLLTDRVFQLNTFTLKPACCCTSFLYNFRVLWDGRISSMLPLGFRDHRDRNKRRVSVPHQCSDNLTWSWSALKHRYHFQWGIIIRSIQYMTVISTVWLTQVCWFWLLVSKVLVFWHDKSALWMSTQGYTHLLQFTARFIHRREEFRSSLRFSIQKLVKTCYTTPNENLFKGNIGATPCSKRQISFIPT